MYLRYTTGKKGGKIHRAGRLVRSVRVGGHRRVAHLGKLDRAGRLRCPLSAHSSASWHR